MTLHFVAHRVLNAVTSCGGMTPLLAVLTRATSPCWPVSRMACPLFLFVIIKQVQYSCMWIVLLFHEPNVGSNRPRLFVCDCIHHRGPWSIHTHIQTAAMSNAHHVVHTRIFLQAGHATLNNRKTKSSPLTRTKSVFPDKVPAVLLVVSCVAFGNVPTSPPKAICPTAEERA